MLSESISTFSSPFTSALLCHHSKVFILTTLIEHIKSITSSKPGSCCLVLFLPLYSLLIPSELNHLSLAATFSQSLSFFHPFWCNLFSICFVSFIFYPGLFNLLPDSSSQLSRGLVLFVRYPIARLVPHCLAAAMYLILLFVLGEHRLFPRCV